MSEWHVPPDYIVNNWTDELFELMVEKLSERKMREQEEMKKTPEQRAASRKVTDQALFNRAGSLIKVVKQ